ncbi:MAG TPA: sterol desaturase family protein, partial [Thermoanaerobaculia bacterium]|nr:sterol desaturase family protein [Thermoanaerobaculia bacterium]
MPLDRFLIDNAMAVRVGCFLGVLVVMALLELLIPRREQKVGRLTRWPGNLGIVVVDTLLVRLLIPVSLVGFALWAEERGWGLLPLLGVPAIIAVPLTVLALDLLIYAQHVVFHHVPMLWRLHRMHHADLELDVTSGTRFHPIEILLS